MSQRTGSGAEASNNTEAPPTENQEFTQAAYGEWITVQHSRRRGTAAAKGKSGISSRGKEGISMNIDNSADTGTDGAVLNRIR